MSQKANLIALTPELISFVAQYQRPARKQTQALLRLPTVDEVGLTLNTWVEKNGEKVLETTATIGFWGVIAKNPQPLSDGSFNEFIFPKDIFMEHYGEEQYAKLTTEFQPMSKKISCVVVLITPVLKNMLKDFVTSDNKITFMATFNLEMKVDVGDYFVINSILNCMDYGIDGEQFNNTYQFLDNLKKQIKTKISCLEI